MALGLLKRKCGGAQRPHVDSKVAQWHRGKTAREQLGDHRQPCCSRPVRLQPSRIFICSESLEVGFCDICGAFARRHAPCAKMGPANIRLSMGIDMLKYHLDWLQVPNQSDKAPADNILMDS